MKRLRHWLAAGILVALASTAAHAATEPVPLHAYLTASCIIADEPFYAPDGDAAKAGAPRAKFLPLIGLVVGKLAEVFITREMESSASQIKVRAARKDTLYTVISPLNLYLADGSAPPRLKLNPHLGCLTIVAAKLSPQGTDCTAAYLPKQVPAASKPTPAASAPAASAPTPTDPAAGAAGSVENSLRRANICVQGSARAVYEARIELSEDATAFRLHSTGYQINSLLSTTQAKAARASFYAVKIMPPTGPDNAPALADAAVQLGTVRAGARSDGAEPGLWQRLPPPSVDSQRAFDQRTHDAQDLSGQIEALQRSVARAQRTIADLDERIPQQSGAVADQLKQERDKLTVQYQLQSAQLDGLSEELKQMPPISMQFMPIMAQVSVTETESEKTEDLALADIIGQSSGFIGGAVGDAVTADLTRSLKHSASRTDEFGNLRNRYFDARIAYRFAAPGDAPALARQLQQARRAYNQARMARGLEALP
jgi:hypothetical protein